MKTSVEGHLMVEFAKAKLAHASLSTLGYRRYSDTAKGSYSNTTSRRPSLGRADFK
jgi:hypothetical protein